MRRILSRTARAGLRAIATLRSTLPMARGARIITYHSIHPQGSGSRSAHVHPVAFAQQMAWLATSGYEVVSLSALVERLIKGSEIPHRWICITFDDGYVDNYVYAFPVLKKLGYAATIFLTTGKIDKNPDFLTLAHIREMQRSGIAFGAHTVDHISLSSASEKEAHAQILQSKQHIEDWLHKPVHHFCYPFGHYNASVERCVHEAGFASCCTEQAGSVLPGANPLRLRRVGILGTDSMREYQLKVQGAYDWWINTYMRIEETRRLIRGGINA